MKKQKEKEKKKDVFFIIGNKTRREILDLLTYKSWSATEIKETLKISSYGLLYQHLKILEKSNLITRRQIKDRKGKKKQGRKTIISLKKPKPMFKLLQYGAKI